MSINRALQAIARFDDAAQEWLRRGFQTWLDCGGAITLERALGLPSSASGLARAMRDHHLRRAFFVAPGETTDAKLAALEDELRPLLSWRGRVWRTRGVPDRASEVERHLFNALESGAPMPSSAKWRRAIVLGSFWGKELPSEWNTTEAEKTMIEARR